MGVSLEVSVDHAVLWGPHHFESHPLAPDFTDAALVTLASIHRINRIITVDVRDFSAYRLSDGRPFERLWL
jgi:hypothetical protein